MQRVFAIVALAFFCLPLGLRAAGVHANPFENRDLAAAPTLSAGWDAFDQATRFFVDRLPLREQAVQANTWVSLHVWDALPDYERSRTRPDDALPFGTPRAQAPPQLGSPAPGAATTRAGGASVEVQPGLSVLRGTHGWLYLGEELSHACEPAVPWRTAAARLRELVSIVRASGRDAVFAIPPDKSTIYPEFLPDGDYAGRACAGPARSRTWATIEAAEDPPLLGLRRGLLARKAADPEPTYWANDTHWNTKGATVAASAILAALGGNVRLRADEIVKSRESHRGDLSGLIGLRGALTGPLWRVVRAPAAPTLPGRTLFVGDSFGATLRPVLGPYARDFEHLPWLGLTPEQLTEAIGRADTVIFERVERDATELAQAPITPAFLDRLRARLATAP